MKHGNATAWLLNLLTDMMNKTASYITKFVIVALILSGFSSASYAFGIRAPFEVKREPANANSVTSVPPATQPPPAMSTFKAYWDGKNVNAAQWTLLTQDAVSKYGPAMLKGTADIGSFCPQYDRLGTQDRTNFWVQLLAAMTKYESGFNPASRMIETTAPDDPVTGAPTSSEGLLQLSYSDQSNYKSVVPPGVCEFDYARDKQYPVTDLRRTILDPKTNITCAVGILNHQLQKYNKIAVGRGAYWAVIKTDRSTNKLTQIRAITKSLAFCN